MVFYYAKHADGYFCPWFEKNYTIVAAKYFFPIAYLKCIGLKQHNSISSTNAMGILL